MDSYDNQQSKNPEDILRENRPRRITVNDMKFWHNDMEAVLAIVAVLVVLGSINVFSSSFAMSEMDYDTPYHFIQRHAINMVISLVLGVACFKFDYHKIGNLVPVIAIVLVITLVAVWLVGIEINGARRWLGVGSFSIQPAEFAKLCSIVIMAKTLEYRIKRGKRATVFCRMTGFLLLLAFLIELEPDMGTAMICFGIPILMMLIVGIPHWQKAVILFGAAGAAVGMVHMQSYRLQRLLVWYDPFADAQGVGYQTVRSLTAIGSGGWWGMGLGQGVSKYNYLLPEAHTDFAFAIFAQENGFFIVTIVLLLFSLLAFHMVRIAGSAKDVYGHLLAVGIMILIVGQAIFNMLMVSGVFPVIGVPLPFISYGGSSLMVTMMAIGILMNIAYQGEQERVDKLRKMKKEEIASRPKKRPLLRLVKQ